MAAVEAFQYRRGLDITGICTQLTWDTLVEACYRLGDRILYLAQPLMKGDDIAELQRRLSALGFDIGKVDGMFGKDTANGLAEFQSNVGLHADSVCGYRTLAELDRVLFRHSDTELVASVKDREKLRHRPKTLAKTTVFIANSGGLDVLVSALKRGISDSSATVLQMTHPSGSVQAASANAVGADVCLALLLTDSPKGTVISYYAGHTYESPGGRRLAELSGQYLKDFLNTNDVTIKGMSVPILRETKMPSILCQIGPASYVVKFTSSFAAALAHALIDWAIRPIVD